MKEIYDKITNKRSGIPLMEIVKDMNRHDIYNLARYMYWSSSIINQQYDLYFTDDRYKERTDLFVGIIYSVRTKVTKRFTFNYIDYTELYDEFSKIIKPDREYKINFLLSKFLDYVHLNHPYSVMMYRLLMTKKNRPHFQKFVVDFLKKNNNYYINRLRLTNMYQLFWQLSCPTPDAVGFQHAMAIATYNIVDKKELELGSFFDFMDDFD